MGCPHFGMCNAFNFLAKLLLNVKTPYKRVAAMNLYHKYYIKLNKYNKIGACNELPCKCIRKRVFNLQFIGEINSVIMLVISGPLGPLVFLHLTDVAKQILLSCGCGISQDIEIDILNLSHFTFIHVLLGIFQSFL